MSVLATMHMAEALPARVRLGGSALDKPAWQTDQHNSETHTGST